MRRIIRIRGTKAKRQPKIKWSTTRDGFVAKVTVPEFFPLGTQGTAKLAVDIHKPRSDYLEGTGAYRKFRLDPDGFVAVSSMRDHHRVGPLKPKSFPTLPKAKTYATRWLDKTVDAYLADHEK